MKDKADNNASGGVKNPDKVFIIDSHRGAFKNGLLENSLPAFKESYLEGANCVECDIRITKDGEIVLIHNSTIDHIMGYAEYIPPFEEFHESPIGPVKEHTLAFLKAVKFPNNAQILTLKEFLVDVLDKFKLGTQIELKEGGYEDKILKAIEEASLNYEEHLAPVVCTSFNYIAVRRLLSLSRNYDIPLYTHQGDIGVAFGIQGIKLGIPIFGKWFLRKCYRDNIWGGMTHYSNLPARRIEYGHKYHFHFIPRVPNDKKLVMAYIRHDVDGFETNNISFIRECIKEAGYNLPPLPKI